MTEIPDPILLKSNGWFLMNASPVSKYGFGTIRGMTKFVEEAQKYKRRIFVRGESIGEIMDLKSIMGAMMASTECGGCLEFMIEGNDKEAERMALRLYSGATSEDITMPDFERYERGCPWAHS